jgi:exopolyphosphatase/guanosine-5'-triphosphate,3'-diphosphate pyrophosphatase
MRKAIIDLGTNTFNLLIGAIDDTGFSVIYSEKEGVALGMGGINEQIISPEAYKRGISALSRFKLVCDKYHVQNIQGIGTSALRDATNALDFIEEVKGLLGIEIEIISGLQEAELIYKGVKWTYSFEQPAVIMDIGGGSTEFVFADKQGITDLVSLNIGVSRIYQYFSLSDPLNQEDISNIEEWLDENALGFFDGKQESVLIGASGSFETFYELMHQMPFPKRTKAVEISMVQLMECLNEIIASTQEERDKNDWIIPIRKKMAPIAAVKTRWVLGKLNIKKVHISPFSLKEGAFAE